ncbi:MAG: hypothetical protein EOL89_13820 [Actinobacteria bacterium]|nr:hypothetical protein [Actinomycetota bacterium]
MALGYDTLRVELAEVEPGSRRAGILRTLSTPFGGTTLHFVGVVDGERRYTGPTFLCPRFPAAMPPREDWAPGLGAALAELRREVEAAGWEYLGQGEQPWDLFYRRPRWE